MPQSLGEPNCARAPAGVASRTYYEEHR